MCGLVCGLEQNGTFRDKSAQPGYGFLDEERRRGFLRRGPG